MVSNQYVRKVCHLLTEQSAKSIHVAVTSTYSRSLLALQTSFYAFLMPLATKVSRLVVTNACCFS